MRCTEFTDTVQYISAMMYNNRKKNTDYLDHDPKTCRTAHNIQVIICDSYNWTSVLTAKIYNRCRTAQIVCVHTVNFVFTPLDYFQNSRNTVVQSLDLLGFELDLMQIMGKI